MWRQIKEKGFAGGRPEIEGFLKLKGCCIFSVQRETDGRNKVGGRLPQHLSRTVACVFRDICDEEE